MDDNSPPGASRELPMPSSRSDYQAKPGVDPDPILITPSEMKPQAPNNHYVEFKLLKIDPLVFSILQNHPMRYALTIYGTIPEIFVQQAWKTIKVTTKSVGTERISQFELQIDHFKSILDYQRFRYILNLPEDDAREGRISYNDFPTDTEVFQGIRNLGYNAFKEDIQSTKLCALSEVLHNYSQKHAQKQQRHPKETKSSSCTSKCNEISDEAKEGFSYFMPIPEGLLDYADPKSECVVSYRESMGQPGPVIPTQGSILRREESRPRLEASGSQSITQRSVTPSANESQVSENETDPTAEADDCEEIPSTTSENDETEHDGVAAADDDDDNDGYDFDQNDQDQGDAGIQADDTENVDVFEQFYVDADMEIDLDTTIRNVVGEIRSNEGALVEILNERMSVMERKEYGERVCNQTYRYKRAATSTTSSHVLRASVEQSSCSIGTPRVDSIAELQGPGGSPAIANITPTMNTGHAVASSNVMTTESLRDSDVTLPVFVMQESLNGALKDVETKLLDKIEEEVCGVNRLLKGKEPVVKSEYVSQVQPTPQSTQPADMSINELKSLLFAKLLSQAPENQTVADLLSLLQSQHQTQTPPSVQPTDVFRASEFNYFKVDKDVERESTDHGNVMTDQNECRELVLYVDSKVEPRVSKPKVATRAEILEITGMEFVDIIDLSSDDEEEAFEKYAKFWKVKEEEKENFMEGSDEKNVQDDVIPEGEANFLDTLLEENRDSDSLQIIYEQGTPNDIHLSPVHSDMPEVTTVAPVFPLFSEFNFPEASEVPISQSEVGLSNVPKAPLVPTKTEHAVKNKSGIVTIKEVRLKKFFKIWYGDFHVQRRDMSERIFTEADFQFLNVDDLKHMYHLFRTMAIRKENIIFTLEAIKRFMRRHIFYTYFYDFQLGIETNQKKVNMLKPNLTLSNIDNYDMFTVLEEPELGQGGEHLPRRVKLVMLRILEAIDDRIDFRRGIMRFESLLGIRDNRVRIFTN
ncbi:hypothetical protein L6452_01980 [Arctium lappa]|uniref:Uncharacterized protein n=1 Tax=Arctium lappa TaxID=4217 RepID=A0ACB9FI68_ARCLA|nr:hypothetical protein L6452_01980 [Arctium lappa]